MISEKANDFSNPNYSQIKSTTQTAVSFRTQSRAFCGNGGEESAFRLKN